MKILIVDIELWPPPYSSFGVPIPTTRLHYFFRDNIFVNDYNLHQYPTENKWRDLSSQVTPYM